MDINIPSDAIIDKVFSRFKKVTPALVAVLFVTGAILFLPDSILLRLGLFNLSDFLRTTLGILFLLSAALIVTILLSSFWKSISTKIRNKKTLHNLRNKYIALSPEQKEIIIKLLESSEKSISLDMTSGNTIYLQENSFIYRPSQVVPFGYGDIEMKFIPQPWLLDLYNKEPQIFSNER